MINALLAATVLALPTVQSAPEPPLDWGDHRPVMSPDGSTWAFMSNRTGTWSIYTMPVGAKNPTRVSDNAAGEWYPDWSPDGRSLVYYRSVGEESTRRRQLFLYDVATGRERQLTFGEADQSYARWTGEGALLYHRDLGQSRDLYVMEPGSEQHHKLAEALSGHSDPAPSPDGMRLVVMFGTESGNQEIALARMNGQERRVLVTYTKGTYGLDWSPDGRLIVYNTEEDGDHEIHVFDLESGEDRQLTHNDSSDHLPRWTPDGARLVFTSERSGVERVYTMRPDGSNVRRVDTGGPGD